MDCVLLGCLYCVVTGSCRFCVCDVESIVADDFCDLAIGLWFFLSQLGLSRVIYSQQSTPFRHHRVLEQIRVYKLPDLFSTYTPLSSNLTESREALSKGVELGNGEYAFHVAGRYGYTTADSDKPTQGWMAGGPA